MERIFTPDDANELLPVVRPLVERMVEGNATITVRALAEDPSRAERLQHDLRLRAHRRLRAAGIYA
jgi:hypothetical protein